MMIFYFSFKLVTNNLLLNKTHTRNAQRSMVAYVFHENADVRASRVKGKTNWTVTRQNKQNKGVTWGNFLKKKSLIYYYCVLAQIVDTKQAMFELGAWTGRP